MNTSRKLSVLIASGALALAISLSAQTTSPGSASPAPGAKPDAREKNPLPNPPPVKPNPPPQDPTVSSTAADENKSGSGVTGSAANSGSGKGGRETLLPPPASAKDATPSRQRPTTPVSPQFNTLDADRDGRISLTEFTTPSAAWLREGASGVGVSGGSVTGSGATGTPGSRDTTGRTPPPASKGPLSGPSSSTDNAKLFQKVDTNRDGYLSPAELDVYRPPTTLER